MEAAPVGVMGGARSRARGRKWQRRTGLRDGGLRPLLPCLIRSANARPSGTNGVTFRLTLLAGSREGPMAELAGAEDRRPNRYEMLVQSVTDYAIYMLAPTGIVACWNADAQRFKGYLEHEIIGEHFSRFYTEEDRATGLPKRAQSKAQNEGSCEAAGWRVR